MALFDDIPRSGGERKEYAEPDYTFLNRSARPDVEGIRVLLEDWFARYPKDHQLDLQQRFRSTKNAQHRGAFFELLLHELHLRLGCRVTVHPEPPGGGGTVPDFLIADADGNSWYLEAALVTGESEQEVGEEKRKREVYDYLDRQLQSPDFFLTLELAGAPDTPVPVRRLTSYLQQQLSAADYDQLKRAFDEGGHRALPRWEFAHDGWELTIVPVPKNRLRGQKGVRPVMSRFEGLQWDEPHIPIRSKVLKKARKYGEFDRPYIVALNCLDFGVERIDVLDALFGREVTIASETTGGTAWRTERKPDGVWLGPEGPICTRLSAVLVFDRVHPWNVADAAGELYLNPWANWPYVSVLNTFRRMVPTQTGTTWMPEFLEGIRAADVLGLSGSPQRA